MIRAASIFSEIWDAITDVPQLIINGIVWLFNTVLSAISAMGLAALAILPPFPAAPDAPDSGVLGLLNWVIPLGSVVSLFAIFVLSWATFLGVKAALKWVKAL